MSQTEKNSEVVKNQILAMYNSKEYQELAAYYNKPTFFEILGIKRSEDRNTNFLSWLLNDKSSHRLGLLPFNKFLRMLALNSEDENKFDLYKSLISGQYNIENLDIQVQKDCEIYLFFSYCYLSSYDNLCFTYSKNYFSRVLAFYVRNIHLSLRLQKIQIKFFINVLYFCNSY